ncbi:MAG TPA: DUF202 domain-containing protein [Streptosporangiaceae bacterium]|nr:DUF202 domain-containing protein [Streptosporangiaceae bacterium]
MAAPNDPEDADPGLARARTQLAWIRTALSVGALGAVIIKRDIAAGLAVLAVTPLIWWIGHLFATPAATGALPRRLLLVTVTIIGVSLVALAVAVTGR